MTSGPSSRLDPRTDALPERRRSQARMLAVQALCVFDGVGQEFVGRLDAFLSDPLVLHELHLTPPLPPDVLSFARTVALGTFANRARYDEWLARTAADWSVARMALVDRNVLRLGLHELLDRTDSPPAVIINEALELARAFGGTDSVAFVNGVLDAVRRELGVETPTSPGPGALHADEITAPVQGDAAPPA